MSAQRLEQRQEHSSRKGLKQITRDRAMDKTELYARDISGVTWRKSRYSEVDMSECVEVAELGNGAVAVRDSNNLNRRSFDSLLRSGRPSSTGSATASSDHWACKPRR